MIRWALAVLLGCVALLACTSPALAAEDTGQISGTVTEAVSHEGLKGIEVTVYEVGGSEFSVAFATTGEHGEYTVEGLASGIYQVEFSPEFESGLNYVTQFYRGVSSLAAAEPVTVVQGATTSGIDAELQVGGEIEGQVTEAVFPHDGLRNIEVTVYEAQGSESQVGFATTDTEGKYKVVGLAEGSYKVRFAPEFESTLNFVPQYYKERSSLASADPVEVVQGVAKAGIDAELQVGGKIEGTVTDASTHMPLSKVYVFAIAAGEVIVGQARTNANGRYTILGLASGSYKIEFVAPSGGTPYIVQFYNDESSLASANPVTATQGSTIAGVNASLVREAPVNIAPPVASGKPTVSRTLSCTTGSWTGSPTPTYAYTWLRNGIAIPGANASTYVIKVADRGARLACKVTATNKNGSAAAVSNTLTVPAAPPPPSPPAPPRPVVKFLTSKIVVSHGWARVPVACANANCAGTIALAALNPVFSYDKLYIPRFVALGQGHYSLAAGHRATIVIHLSKKGKPRLAAAKHHRLTIKLIASVIGGATARESAVLSKIVRKKHRGRHRRHRR